MNSSMRAYRGLSLLVAVFLLTLAIRTARLAGQDGSERKPTSSELSIDAIFAEKRFQIESFSGHWQADSQGFEQIRKDPLSGDCSIVQVRLAGAMNEEVVIPSAWLKPPAQDTALKIDSYQWSPDRTKLLLFANTQRVWRLNTRGDYWLLNLADQRLTQLGGDAEEATLMFAKFSPDGMKVAYVRNHDIYLQDLSSLEVTRLTSTGSATRINGTFDWVYEEEFSIRDGFRFSPDGKRIAFWELDSSGIELFPLVDNTSTLYPKLQFIPYPKVGTINPAARIGLIDLQTQATRWIAIPGDPRENYLPRMDWVDSQELAIQQLNRLQNHLQFYLADAATGTAHCIYQDKDEAWLDVADKTLWLEDKSAFLWLSERSGWRHLYKVSRDGKTVDALTQGNFDVIDVLGIDSVRSVVYFYASPDNATQKYLYEVTLQGQSLRRVTPEDWVGTHDYVMSPDNQRALVTASRFAQPPQTSVVALREHVREHSVQVNEKVRASLSDASFPTHEFFRVALDDGVELDAWCIVPPNFDPSKKYPLLIYVYGEPAGQTVLDRWGGDRTLWHYLLAQHGYVVMSFDNRGTPSPRGRAWRKSVYRQIGILASTEQAAAVRSVLASRPYLDPKRVGVWGWSGGGSMTLNLLFRFPELYATGVSIAPVPNQLYYDTIYQERYMGLPADNPEGYRDGSPITFAHRLQGELLLIHGTGDDNCHFQTSELLMNELIKQNKQFSMFAYPNRSHAIREGENTTRHLYQKITDHFRKTLPSGGR